MDERLDRYFDELVPEEGQADTVAGEVVRALNKIAYRFYNDGDVIGIGYGNETCNPPARFLAEKTSSEIEDLILTMWGSASEEQYEEDLKLLVEITLDWVDSSNSRNEKNNESMLDYDSPEDHSYMEEEEY